jgi:hypothetical protein
MLAALDSSLVLRWRPHPADAPDAVARALARIPPVELSQGRPLAEDLDWCDVLVTSQSTALIEAILVGVPSFVHVTPEYERELGWVAPERAFFHAEDLVPRFARWMAALESGDPLANDADARARHALFGPTEKPRPFREALAVLLDEGRSAG